MAPEDLRKLLQAKPFLPLKIVTTADTTYEIRHPDLVMVGTNAIVLGTPDQQHPDFFTGVHVVSLFHVVRIEVMTPVAPE